MAEFWRALKTLKGLQAEQAADAEAALGAHPAAATPVEAHPPEVSPMLPAARPPLVDRAQPDEPERGGEPRPENVPSGPAAPALHEPAAPWLPNEPEIGRVAGLSQPPISAEPIAMVGAPRASGRHVSGRS
jgi:hypothetical protein